MKRIRSNCWVWILLKDTKDFEIKRVYNPNVKERYLDISQLSVVRFQERLDVLLEVGRSTTCLVIHLIETRVLGPVELSFINVSIIVANWWGPHFVRNIPSLTKRKKLRPEALYNDVKGLTHEDKSIRSEIAMSKTDWAFFNQVGQGIDSDEIQ